MNSCREDHKYGEVAAQFSKILVYVVLNGPSMVSGTWSYGPSLIRGPGPRTGPTTVAKENRGRAFDIDRERLVLRR
jgi:hypothetical protein